MRVLIDLQGAQSAGGGQRGIGRYSISMAKAIVRQRGVNEVLIVLNGRLADSVDMIRAAFSGLLDQEHIRVWYPPEGVHFVDGGVDARRTAAEYTREAFLRSLSPDIVYVTSIFEGLDEDAVVSIGTFDQELPTVVSVYDFIPFAFGSPYLDDPRTRRFYTNKKDQLRRAGRLFAISEYSRQECLEYVGCDERLVRNVSAGVDSKFRQLALESTDSERLSVRYGIRGAFVMYTGGFDVRKNVNGLIRAYAQLPQSIRKGHQLVIVGRTDPETEMALNEVVRDMALSRSEVVFTGFVSDDDLIVLYNLCTLFVLPSLHEGFGLPALEAMACGAATIASDATSLPEVIGREEALFDPLSEASISEKLGQALTDSSFRAKLRNDGLKQAGQFSWDRSAKLALSAFRELHGEQRPRVSVRSSSARRSRLAYVAPLPPESTENAVYSTILLPELSRHYNVEVIVDQSSVTDDDICSCYPVRSKEWFRDHSANFDRVLYSLGNSIHHGYAYRLLESIPGYVVLNDFFLGAAMVSADPQSETRDAWVHDLYRSHGLSAVREFYEHPDLTRLVSTYPCNFNVVQKAIGIAVHTRCELNLFSRWYGGSGTTCADIVPRGVSARNAIARQEARHELGIGEDDFVVISFGRLGPSTAEHGLLQAWWASTFSRDPLARLVFALQVGEYHRDTELERAIRFNDKDGAITGVYYEDVTKIRHYLEACDVSVHLSDSSQAGRTSALLECMALGLPAVVGADDLGSGLPSDAVYKIGETASKDELLRVLEQFRKDSRARNPLSDGALKHIRECHSPRVSVDRYRDVIESAYEEASRSRLALAAAVVQIGGISDSEETLFEMADVITKTLPAPTPARRLFVDVSEFVQRDAGTGIQRVTRNILRELLRHPPDGFRVEPVYGRAGVNGYWFARKFSLKLMNCEAGGLTDEPIEASSGDVFVGLDFYPYVAQSQLDSQESLRQRGVKLYFVVYDLLTIQRPDVFGESFQSTYTRWLRSVSHADGAICISRTVAMDLRTWMEENEPDRPLPFRIGWFHLGTDSVRAVEERNASMTDCSSRDALGKRPTILMVGTIEPRKGHAVTVAAFDELWRQGIDVNLVIVGRKGWMMESFINGVVKHPEHGKRLLWLNGIDDQHLETIYSRSSALLAASEGEGFGLPLIEAARHGLPIIARDIPVFREVAGRHAYFFRADSASELASALREWLMRYRNGTHPDSSGIRWISWRQSTDMLMDVVLGNHWMFEVRRGETRELSA